MALIVICGATATGKSGLGIALAQRLETKILSADSRQVYRQFDIGTAKPTLAQQQLVPHELIDICDPTETLTLADYQQQAQNLIAQIKNPLLVGGTGLYIKAIVKGLKIPRVAPQPQLRSQFQQLGQTHCYALLQQVDHLASQKIHPNDRVRTGRALEVYYVTGKPISQQQGENPPNYPILQLGLQLESDRLSQRIQQRTELMVEMGFVEEVKSLIARYGETLPLLQTLGYQEMIQYILGKIGLDEAIALTVLHTRQFAKRQRTWFRAIPEIEWFEADRPDLIEKTWKTVQDFLKLHENHS
ncbi:MAG: tRNA (adenosine(37)-N6)-dimethylallyltransferase MiaA [Microcoleaceae cyanobacterium]